MQKSKPDVYDKAFSGAAKNDIPKSIRSVKSELKSNDNPGGWGLLAWLYLQNGEFREGLAAAKKMRNQALSLHSKSLLSIADTLMGLIHQEAGRKVLAERYYREAIDAQRRTETLNLLGNLMVEQGRSIEAKINFQQAVQADANNIEARYNLALWYNGHDDRDRTIKHLEKVIEADIEFKNALELYCVTLWHYGTNGMNKSREVLEEALIRDVSNEKRHLLLGLTLQLMNKLKDAEKQYRFIIENFESSVAAPVLLAKLLARKTRNHTEVEELFKKAIREHPESGFAHYYYADFLMMNDCFPEARELLKKANKLGFEKADLLLDEIIEDMETVSSKE